MLEEVDLTASSPPSKRQRRLVVAADVVDLTHEEDEGSQPSGTGAAASRPESGGAGQPSSRLPAAAAAAASGLRGGPGAESSGVTAPHPRQPSRGRTHPAPRILRRHQQQQQQQPQRRSSPAAEQDDWAVAKRMQEEEDRRAAAAVESESHLQRRFRELEAAESAAEAAAGSTHNRGWGRGFLGGWFGGGGGQRSGRGGSSSAAAAAAAAGGAGGGGGAGFVQPRAATRGPRSQRSRRGPAAEADFANEFAAFLPPFHHMHRGGRGGALFGAGIEQLVVGLSRGLPADLLFSGRDFTDADYEQLLALDAGNKKKTAPRERVAALETVRIPPSGSTRGAAAGMAAAGAAARGGGLASGAAGKAASGAAGAAADGAASGACSPTGSGSSGARLDTCAICLEDARPGDCFRVLGCRHGFHMQCIDRWLTQERNSCPICQREAV